MVLGMESRLWFFTRDMNADGIVTPDDVGAWVHWLYFYPGDFFIKICLTLGMDPLINFLEFSSRNYGGWLSGMLSFMFWLTLIKRSTKPRMASV